MPTVTSVGLTSDDQVMVMAIVSPEDFNGTPKDFIQVVDKLLDEIEGKLSDEFDRRRQA